MNVKLCRQLRAWARYLAVVKLQSLLPESEHHTVNIYNIESFDQDYDKYVYYRDGSRRLSAFSIRYFYKKLKKYSRMGLDPFDEVSKLINEAKA